MDFGWGRHLPFAAPLLVKRCLASWSSLALLAFLLSPSIILAQPVNVPAFLSDLDGDARTTVRDFVILQNHLSGDTILQEDRVFAADLNQDGVIDGLDADILLDIVMGRLRPPATPLARVLTTSPKGGEDGVALSRETIVRLSLPLAEDLVLPDNAIRAEFAGQVVPGQPHLSADRQTVTLFYPSGLPASARVRVTIDGGLMRDLRGSLVDADGDGVPGGELSVDFDTLTVTSLPDTSVCGRIFASDLAVSENGSRFVNRPLAGVTIRVDGTDRLVVTDENGNFRLEEAPAGEFFVHIDGRTVPDVVPAGAYYPNVGKAWVSVPGIETNIGEIYLPLIPADALREASTESDTVLEFTPEFVVQNPKFNGVQVVVPPNSLFRDDGTRGGRVGIAPVQPDRLPGEVASDLPIQDVVTIQTDGATNFDIPAPVCLPNLEDPLTGRRLGPGEPAALWSFNHDLGRFEIVGSMTVNEDGSLICTDPGVGVLAPGWHGSSTGTQGEGGTLRHVILDRSKQEKPGKNDPSADPDNKVTIPCPDNPNRYVNLYKNRRRPQSNPEAKGGDPVYLHSGEFYENMVDLRIAGRGMDFIWSRKYRSVTGRPTVQGNNWDYSYNIFIRAEGNDFLLCDGNSRADIYTLQDSGVWTAPGFFRTLEANRDGTYTLRFEHGGRWVFHPVDGRPESGRILISEERNGNQLRFRYDSQGRLSGIVDSLDRLIEVFYNGDGFIREVRDFAGRSIRYEYFGRNDPDGNFGDLRSVTLPSVTGTPNGNDFPDGKTTTFTYSTGHSDARLNGNLLTITDGRRNDPNDPAFEQGPYLRNEYAPTIDPEDVNFDRIIRQVWGDPDDILDYHYTALLPSNANRRAVNKTIVNDRRGLVMEYLYDEANRLVSYREFTGFAVPDQVTTETDNRPTGKLRATDPDFFETVHEWNADHLLVRTIQPNGTIIEKVYEGDINPNAGPRTRSNLVATRLLPGSHRPAGDQVVIEEFYEYDTAFAGCCGFNFVTKYTDARGNTTTHDYDERGNRIQTIHRVPSIIHRYEYNEFGQLSAEVYPDNDGVRRRDEWAYYEEGPQRGYLRQITRDVDGFALTTVMDYDRVGNPVATTDAKGNTQEFVFNQLDQMVREISRPVSATLNVRYVQDYFYDANNNLIRVDAPNVDHLGDVGSNASYTTTYEYEILNNLIRTAQEIREGEFRVTETVYDANRNRILMRYGEATNGNQTDNTTSWDFDERDLVIRLIQGKGGADQSSFEFDYDPNENLIVERYGIEDAKPQITSRIFDGYDRPVDVTDPMGNRTTYEYDANHNLVRHVKYGELNDQPGSAGNVKLFAENASYDPLNRLTRTDTEFFEVGTGRPLGDGLSTMQYRYNNSSLLVATIDDNGNRTVRDYDSYYRPRRVVDALGNEVIYDYDQLSNVVRVTERDLPDSGGEAEVYVERFDFDHLNRVIRSIDSIGNTSELGYDSRNNLTYRSDANRVTPNQPGNIVRNEFDGLRRHIATVYELTADGQGGTPTGTIRTETVFDHSDRAVGRIDGNGNQTTYTFDGLNRMTGTRFADGTTEERTYNAHSNPIMWVDANGTTIATEYDELNRKRRCEITPGAGVSSDTTFEVFDFDGFSRLRRFADDDSLVEREYTSMSEILRESLNDVVTSAEYDGMGNMLRCVYPSGFETLMSYDGINRLTRIDDRLGLIADPSYVGRHRTKQCVLGNDTVTSHEYDRDRRRIGIEHRMPGSGVFDQRRFAWDSMDNKILHRDELSGESLEFAYDSVYRLTSSGLSDTRQAYHYDSVGNRTRVDGGAFSGRYELDAAVDGPADRQVNQYTVTPSGIRRYDAKGNLLTVGDAQESFTYDYRNQLVAFANPSLGQKSTYRYDALGRRIERSFGSGQTVKYYYQGSRVLEERDAAGRMNRQYVYGRYIDEVVNMRTDQESFYYHSDDTFNVRKITDSSGAVVESYDYDDFGMPVVANGEGLSVGESQIGNTLLFNGRRFDVETGFYFYRSRYLDPRVGRFTSRDYIGTWGDLGNMGNAFSFVANNPRTLLDPTGMEPLDGERRPWDKDTPTGTQGHFHWRPLHGEVENGWVEWTTRSAGWWFSGLPEEVKMNWIYAHEHYFEGTYDESKPRDGHIGFGGEDPEYLSEYNEQSPGSYSDDVMRAARDMIDKDFTDGSYGIPFHNCQLYADELRRWYDLFLKAVCEESSTSLSKKDRWFIRELWVSRFGDVDIVSEKE